VKQIAKTLTDKQANDLCETVGQTLVAELGAATVKTKVDKIVADYVKKNKIESKPEELSKKLHWSVKVTLS